MDGEISSVPLFFGMGAWGHGGSDHLRLQSKVLTLPRGAGSSCGVKGGFSSCLFLFFSQKKTYKEYKRCPALLMVALEKQTWRVREGFEGARGRWGGMMVERVKKR